MKNKFLRLVYLFSVSLFCSLFACDKIEENLTIIKVDIKSAIDETFSISNNSFSYTKELQPSNNGFTSIIDTLILPKSGYYTFSFRQKPIQLYLTKGEKVGISFKADDFLNSITFSEGSKNENIYLMDKYRLNYRYNRTNSTSLKSEKFLAALFTHRDAMLKLVDKSKASPIFKDKEIKEITYQTAIDQLSYSSVHANLKGRKSLDIGPNYYASLPSINYSDTTLYANSETGNYPYLVKYYFAKIANDKKKEYGNDKTLAFLNEVDLAFPNGYAKDELFHSKLKEGLDGNNPNLDEIYSLSLQSMQNEAYLKALKEDYTRIVGLKRGIKAPNFTLEDYTGQTISLDDFKGRLVYIDVWATSNSEALQELPALKERINEYKNIEFITVSLDTKDDYEKWKSYSTARNIRATSLIAYTNSQFQKDYYIRSIPTYILIDPKGNIVSVNAPKPSEAVAFKKLIDKIPR